MKLHAPDLSAPRGPQTSKDGFRAVPNQAPAGSRRGNEADSANPIPEKSASSRRRLRADAPLGLHPRTRWDAFLPALAVVLLLLTCLPVSARTIYVSKSGQDGNDGSTTSRAVLTVTRAHALASAAGGDVISVGAGIYLEAPPLTKRVTFVASGGTAIIGAAGLAPTLDVDAGDPVSTTVGSRLFFAGSATINDVEIEPPFSGEWKALGDPPPPSVVFEQRTPDGLGAWVRFNEKGTFTLRLTVRVQGLTAFSDVNISVDPPIDGGTGDGAFSVRIGSLPGRLVGRCDCQRSPAFLVNSQIGGSAQNAGANPTYLWQLVAGPPSAQILTPAAPNTELRFTEPGCYRFRLTVIKTATGESKFAEGEISVSPTPAKSYLEFTDGPKCPLPPGSGTVVSATPVYLKNTHGCASISFRAKKSWYGGQVPTIHVEYVTGTLAPGASQLIHCSSADVPRDQLQARYETGCGVGDPDGCGPQTLPVEVPAPRLIALRADDLSPAMIVDTVMGRTNVVEVSSNCRDWTVLTNVVGGDLPYLIRDPQTTHEASRFYRARVQ